MMNRRQFMALIAGSTVVTTGVLTDDSYFWSTVAPAVAKRTAYSYIRLNDEMLMEYEFPNWYELAKFGGSNRPRAYRVFEPDGTPTLRACILLDCLE